ncbi:MAG: integrase, partial [Thermodesulfobacteriota bacterium]|nr:integrase [Thermodesulfobacteriota bacterium]
MDTCNLTLDDRFHLLLHKKIMNKSGSAKRRAKKYYKDQYKKTGIIPGPLLLVEKGIMEGRRCSGRPRSLNKQARKRFVEMVKASCDPSSQGFIFITQKARTIKNYHHWLEDELNRSISLAALRRCVKRENLKAYLNKPDFEDDIPMKNSFKSEPVFDLIQMDGCAFRYLKIRNDKGHWQKPQVIEFYDTGSRHMFVLDAYFSESS